MPSIQELFDRAPLGVLTLEKGDYEGPLILDHPCSVDGRGSLLWAHHGPVVQVASAGPGAAVLRNFRVEVSPLRPSPLENLAVAVVCGEVRLEHVELAGEALGVPGEETGWDLPRAVALGAFASGTENRFTLELNVPAEAELEWKTPGLRAEPRELKQGRNRVTVTLPVMENGAALWAPLWVRTGVSRRMLLSGKALKRASRLTADDVAAGAPLAALRRSGGASLPFRLAGEILVRGQRKSLGEVSSDILTAELFWEAPPPAVTLLPYVFLLGRNGRVRGDGDLVSPGNPLHRSGAVCLTTECGGPAAAVRLSELPEETEKLLICFAPQEGGDLSTLREPSLRLMCRERELFRIPLDRLHRQKIVAAAELYRYKGEWRLNPVGMGYAGGLKQLCADYGVETPM